jgi:hypothetical protein
MNLPRSVFIAVVMMLSYAVGGAVEGHAAQNASCTFETFSAPSGYTFSMINGVSDDGTVVGQLVNNKTQAFMAFTRSASGAYTEYSAPKSVQTWIYGQSGTGLNAGSYQDLAYPEHIHGFQLQNGNFTAVNYPSAVNTWLYDSNMTGASVGSYINASYVTKGFLVVNGKYTNIAYGGSQTTNALAVNDNQEVVGSYSSGVVSNGFAWQNGKFTTINYPNSKYGTVLTGVNNSGVIVGNHISAEKNSGFIYENGGFKGIVYSGAKYTTAGGINNNGLISGEVFINSTNILGYTAVCK